MEMKRQAERAEYEKQISSDQALVKFKPKGELKEYLKNERLVALEERIEEATNFRKELEKFSTKETNRINNEM
jgi:ribosome assembly protein YihI (activator of Der GTPase)